MEVIVWHRLDDFTRGYIEAALWSSMDGSREDGGDPLDDNYGPEDIAQETLREMVTDCRDFQAANAEALEEAYRDGYTHEQAGRDFWLTRNRHGTGFWDRGLGSIGDALTDATHSYGSVDLYVGDDEQIWA